MKHFIGKTMIGKARFSKECLKGMKMLHSGNGNYNISYFGESSTAYIYPGAIHNLLWVVQQRSARIMWVNTNDNWSYQFPIMHICIASSFADIEFNYGTCF